MNVRDYQIHFYQQLRSGKCPIYSGQFIGNVNESLNEIFSLTQKWLGVDEFEDLTSRFAHTHSFSDWSRFQIGNDFPNWVAADPASSANLALIDLLRFELLIHQAEIAGALPTFNVDLFRSWLVGDPRAEVGLHEGCVVLQTRFELHSILTKTPANAFDGRYLIGISIQNQAHCVKLNLPESELLQCLGRQKSYLNWIESIRPESTLANENQLAQFLNKLIMPGWLISRRAEFRDGETVKLI